MDFIVQKCVELGVTEITPLVSQRCNIKLTEDRLLKKQQTLQKIVISACEQCGRAVVPKINPIMDIVDFVKEGTDELKLTLNPYAKFKIKELDVKTKNIRLLVGPEGGFNDTETKMAADNNYTDVLLGPRILRTETAALVAISIIQSQFGDI
jgi:16S rRNA (uracil1498-N3)-methyltransferase